MSCVQVRPHRTAAPAPAPSSRPELVTGLRRTAYIAIGFAFLLLAVLGAFLPVLPTTPFLLLTSYFFVRSSPRLHDRLLKSRVFGMVIRDWQMHRGVRPGAKAAAVTIVLLTMVTSVATGRLSLPLLALLLAGGSIGLIVVLRLPVVPSRER